jgi:hypothetical protein
LRRTARWREEWMRDRALLRDLLKKTPQASPRQLAQATGRQVELGQEMAPAIGRRRSHGSRPVVFALASALYALLPLFPTCGNPHGGEAFVAPRGSGTHAWAAGFALVSAARSSPTSRRRSPAPFQPNGLEAPAEKWMYSTQTAEETTAHGASGAIGRDPNGCARMEASYPPPHSSQSKRKPGDRGVQFCACWHLSRLVCAGKTRTSTNKPPWKR